MFSPQTCFYYIFVFQLFLLLDQRHQSAPVGGEEQRAAAPPGSALLKLQLNV